MSETAKRAEELKERSWTLRETVSTRYDQKLIDLLFKDCYFVGFSHSEDGTYCWGSLAYNDPDILWMVRFVPPGEA